MAERVLRNRLNLLNQEIEAARSQKVLWQGREAFLNAEKREILSSCPEIIELHEERPTPTHTEHPKKRPKLQVFSFIRKLADRKNP